MLGQIPYAQMRLSAQSTAFALAVAQAQFNQWSTNGIADFNTFTDASDVSVQPSKATNQMYLLSPGIYRYYYDFSGTIDTTADLLVQLRKNAATLMTEAVHRQRWTTGVQNSATFTGIFRLVDKDNAGATAVFPDPVAAVAPAVSFTGQGAAPKRAVPIDIMMSVLASTANITIAESRWSIERIG